MENKDTPAFPVLELKEMGGKFLLDLASDGLSKREYFAAMAMQGLLANYEAQKDMQSDAVHSRDSFKDVLAANSVIFADALLKQLEKQTI